MAFEEARGAGRAGKWVRYILLFLSALLIVTGLVGKGKGNSELVAAVKATPAPTLDVSTYDETPDQREITLGRVDWHAVQLGAFENEESALELAKGYQARGAAGYVFQDTRYRVLAALYQSKEDVTAVREQLKTQHEIDSYGFEIALEPIQLRLSGTRGQLDVLDKSFTALDDMVAALQSASLLIDRQELNCDELIARLSGDRSQIAALCGQLALRFSVPRHSAVEGLIAAFQGFEAFMQELDNQPEPSLVRLAAMTKHQSFALLDAQRSLYAEFQT